MGDEKICFIFALKKNEMAAQNEGVYFTKLEIEGFRCFGPKQVLDLSDGKGNWRKWTVILGDNGTGKTSILQLFSSLEHEERVRPNEKSYFVPKGLFAFDSFVQSYKRATSLDRIRKEGKITAKIELFGNPNQIVVSLRNDRTFGFRATYDNKIAELLCYGYGANRFMSFNSLSESKTKNSESLFDDDAKLINAEEWLLQLDYAASKESDVKNYAARKREQVKETLLQLLPNEIDEIQFSIPKKENLKPSLEFHTPYGWVTIHQLSLGYKTMVAWMVDLAARLFERYPDSNNPLAEPAIVLVDEIDLHLHPKWQRKIFDYLSERFPKTQFIVTAHSPLIVQSAPENAGIVVLKREGDHVVIDQNIESVKNWRIDQIYASDLFETTARAPEIVADMEERTKLLQKKSLTKEEERRLKELNKIAHSLPTAENETDRKAMEILRKAAEQLKSKQGKE